MAAATLTKRRIPSNECKLQQHHCSNPPTQYKCSCQIHSDYYPSTDQQTGKQAELQHPEKKYKRQIVRADNHHEGLIKPVQSIKAAAATSGKLEGTVKAICIARSFRMGRPYSCDRNNPPIISNAMLKAIAGPAENTGTAGGSIKLQTQADFIRRNID
jgi:hypothetical protein